MNKGGSNILANCFKKTTKNTKDYIPPTVKQENIREGIQINFPETVDNIYTVNLLPNILLEEWPSEEEINSFDFTNNGEKYTDPNSNLIIFPYSLRKETYSSMLWLRPEEYMKQKNLITAIKERYQNKNYNYIKNKIDLAQRNLLNFDNNVNDSEKEDENSENNNNNEENNNEENKLPDIKPKSIFSSNENMKINIKRRNTIDIANVEGNSHLVREFYNSKLNEEEKKILMENDNKINEFYIVAHEENTENNQVEQQPVKTQANQKNKNAEIQIIYNKLKPSNLNLSIPLCDYCRWVSSQYQILLDNNICTENDKNHFLRKIYPQDKNGVPIYNSSGIYWVKLFHMGKYRKVVIDDKLPVNKETFQTFLPQCDSPLELWPMILTKALIKLYSYKYKCEPYEKDEVGDCSILYSLTKYVGIKLPYYKFIKYLNNLQEMKSKEISNNKENQEDKDNKEKEENNENKNDNIFLNKKNNAEYGYDIIVGYIKSRSYLEDNTLVKGNKIKKLNINFNEKNDDMDKFPQIERNKNSILYTERTYQIKDLNLNSKNRKKLKSLKKPNLNVPPEYQLLYDKLNKNTGISTKKELDPYHNFKRYFEEHRFLTTENIYKNYQKYLTKKTNKFHKSGIICDVGYTLLEIFQCGNFNMKRLKPIYFGDMKLDIKVKYKQMSPEEKAAYLDQIKDLRKKQKKEKENRINQYLDEGTNILCIKFTNESSSNNNKKVYEIETLYNLREIEAAKFCIKNNFDFPPENYFENTFIPKLSKDEETGEINFWTKNFYHKLLKNYFKTEEEIKRKMYEEEKKLELLKKEEEAKSKGVTYIPSYEEENNNDQKYKDHFLFNEFEEKSAGFNEELDKIVENIIPGTWMRFEIFRECFDNFILFKNMEEFKNQIIVDNIWYNYDKDIFEEKETSRIIHLTKIEDNNNKGNKNDENSICLKESELYIIFEPNSEKSKKSVSSELSYETNEETKKGNKFNDILYSISLNIYEVDNTTKKATQLNTYSMNNYFSILNINLSKISKNSESKEYFINIQGGLCPFGYNLQFLSNVYNIENYSYNQFLCDFKNFKEKKINIMHPILPKLKFFLLKTFVLEYKSNEENDNKIVKFMTNFIGYDDNIIKNNIDVVLINSINNKKYKIYYKKIFDINFENCQKYRVELSIIPPGNIPEKNFEYIILYDNPNVNFETFDNIYPFYIRQKYIPNKHNIIFKELLFPSDLITTTLDISLEYRPNDENKSNENTNNNFSDDNLPKEVPFPSSIRMLFYFMEGENLIFKKDFENKSLIRNLVLESKQINQKEKDNSYFNKLILETYSIKCVLDIGQCPSWLLSPNEYKGDVYWKISVFSTDSLTFVKNTIKEDKEKAVIESWEINEPGRKNKAEKSRKKYFVNIKYKNGEVLSPEEEELLPEKINRKEVIESSSNMLVTNIPPKKGLLPQTSQTVNSDEKKQDEINILEKLPKIKNYKSLFMKNFYQYSNQSRVITKNRSSTMTSDKEKCETLPNINQFCKSPEQREKELKDIEEKYNIYYEEMKKDDENNESKKEKYYTIIQEMNDKFIEERKKLLTSSNEEVGNNLNKVIKQNNIMIEKGREIQNFYDEVKSNDEYNDETLFEWYNYFKILNNEKNNKEINLNNKYINMIEEIEKKLAEKIEKRIEIVIKPETKAKPDLIKKYKDIINQNIIFIELKNETQTLLEKCK